MKTNQKDAELLSSLRLSDDSALDELFRRYYRLVCDAVYRILNNAVTTEDIAQEVFLELWKKRTQLDVNTSIKAYLRRAGINKALNYIRDNQKNKWSNEEEVMSLSSSQHIQENLEAKELDIYITNLINSLPEKRRIVFMLSRYEEMTYKEISIKLGISIKTVEHQMSMALKYLRSNLEGYL